LTSGQSDLIFGVAFNPSMTAYAHHQHQVWLLFANQPDGLSSIGSLANNYDPGLKGEQRFQCTASFHLVVSDDYTDFIDFHIRIPIL
jgi:hypothetical protein